MLDWKSALHADEDCVSRGWSRRVGGIPTQIIPAAEALRGEQSQLGGPWAQMWGLAFVHGFTFYLRTTIYGTYLRASLIASLFGKESTCNAGGPGLIPGLGRSPGKGIGYPLQYFWASFVTQLVKNPPAMQLTWVWFLGWEDPLENGKVTHSSILAWRIPWTV